jgi:hypothetical protein
VWTDVSKDRIASFFAVENQHWKKPACSKLLAAIVQNVATSKFIAAKIWTLNCSYEEFRLLEYCAIDVSEVRIAFIIGFWNNVLRLPVTANVVPSTPTLVTAMMEALRSSETTVLTRAIRNIPECGILLLFLYSNCLPTEIHHCYAHYHQWYNRCHGNQRGWSYYPPWSTFTLPQLLTAFVTSHEYIGTWLPKWALRRIYNPILSLKNCVLWDVTPCGSCKNRRFGGN